MSKKGPTQKELLEKMLDELVLQRQQRIEQEKRILDLVSIATQRLTELHAIVTDVKTHVSTISYNLCQAPRPGQHSLSSPPSSREPPRTAQTWLDALSPADRELLEVKEVEGHGIAIRPTRYLGDIWRTWMRQLDELGFRWVKNGLQGYWLREES